MRNPTFVPRDYDGFAGLDVEKRSISVTCTDHQGMSRSMRMPDSVEHLLHYVGKHFPGQQVAFVYEAGPTGYGLYDGLVAHGSRCWVVSPSRMPKAPGQRVKTNRLDSQGAGGPSAWGTGEEYPCALLSPIASCGISPNCVTPLSARWSA